MLGMVSQSALAATALANQIQFICNLFLFGVCSGSAVLIAQYWGRKDTATIDRTIGIALRFALGVGALFSLAAIAVPGLLMRAYSTEAEIIEIGSTYLRIIGIGYVMNAFTQVYVSAMRSTERVMFGTLVNMTSLLLNVALNACFIFGFAFFPKLGVVGVAIATTVSRAVGLLICLLDNALNRHPVKARVKTIFESNPVLFKDFKHYTLPVLGNDIVWGLGFSAYSMILGRLGSHVVAANTYANVVRSLGTVVCFGASGAAGIIMGKTMGENRLDLARTYAKRFFIISVATGLAGALLILCTLPLLVSAIGGYSDLSEQALSYLRFMLIMSAPSVFGQSVNTMLICGIFRAGGDTKFGFITDTITMWGYGVLLGCIAAFVLKLPVNAVYCILFLDEFMKMPFIFVRYFKRKWLRNITRDMSAVEA